jgi:hypothetical protein
MKASSRGQKVCLVGEDSAKPDSDITLVPAA